MKKLKSSTKSKDNDISTLKICFKNPIGIAISGGHCNGVLVLDLIELKNKSSRSMLVTPDQTYPSVRDA